MLEIKGLNVAFGENQVVHDVNFKLKNGEILGIVGESGSGKSMTALSIIGLLPDDALATGEILLWTDKNETQSLGNPEDEGVSSDSVRINLLEMNENEKRDFKGRRISMIFQEPMTSLNPTMRIGKQVEEMLILHGDYPKSMRKMKVIDQLEMVELPNPEEIYRMYPHELSGGMRQRVMIAMATILEPEIIICDEPTTALDAQVQEQILELLCKLNKRNNTSIIFISHDLHVISRISENIVVMHNGNIVEAGTSRDIFENPKDEYTKKLIASIKSGSKDKQTNNNNNILEIKELSVYYKNKGFFGQKKDNYIIRNFNLNIKAGEIVGLVGPSGCGKSTLSKAVMGLHKDYTGQIIHYSKMPQMVFQDPYSSLNPVKTVGWILEEPLRIKGMSKEKRKQKVLEALDEVGLSAKYYKRRPGQLSGGQRQRVSIATAIIGEAEFIIADEPVSALDVTVGAQIIELLLKLQKDRNLAMLFISHDKNVIARVSDRVITMRPEAGKR